MSEAILVLNAGSSSLKFSLYELAGAQLRIVSRGQIEGLGATPRFKAKDASGSSLADGSLPHPSGGFGHNDAFDYLAGWLREHYAGRFVPIGIGHRVVHGGSEFIAPTLVTPRVIQQLEALVPLVPLHQPHNIAAIKAVARTNPDVPQVACFDTAFHQGRPHITQRFALPDTLFQRGIRRWGFHGLSYESISASFKKLAPNLAAGRVIAAHLGNGASLCAMRDGKCIDTTMGFSTLDGLAMGTRCGSIDPGVLLHLMHDMRREDIESLLYKRSGLLGISGISSDVRDLLASREPAAAEAVDYFVYRAIREIGSLTAALGGLDALIFTAGIGENSPPIRQRICQGLAYLGIALDASANRSGKNEISPQGGHPSVWVIPTDEEAVIASHTLSIVQSAKTSNG